MQLRIHVTEDRLTVDDVIAVEDGKMRGIREVFAKLAVDESGASLPLDEARILVGQLTLKQMKEQAEGLARSLKGSAVPPVITTV